MDSVATLRSQLPPFSESGSSPPRSRRRRPPAGSQRYVAHITYTIVRENEPASREKLDAPELVATLARRVIPDDGREHFYIFLLDSQNRLTMVHNVSMGSLSASIVHPREVLGPALREGAAYLILIHNHPSGDPTPSQEDIYLTRQIAEGGTLLGLKVHDHRRERPRCVRLARGAWAALMYDLAAIAALQKEWAERNRRWCDLIHRGKVPKPIDTPMRPTRLQLGQESAAAIVPGSSSPGSGGSPR